MKLRDFLQKNTFINRLLMNCVPLVHPITGEKIYLSAKNNCFLFFSRKPNQEDSPFFFWAEMELEVHPDAEEELNNILKCKKVIQ